jgi:hypothetical protein
VEPNLTPSERGYLFNRDSFLAGIHERGAKMFEDGYRVFATGEPCVFVVTVPQKWGEKLYFLNLVRQTCTCPFFREQERRPLTSDGSVIACKHLEGIETLVKKTARELKEGGNLSYYKLRATWIDIVARRCRSPLPHEEELCRGVTHDNERKEKRA